MSLVLVWRKKCGCRCSAPEDPSQPFFVHGLEWDQMSEDNAARVPQFCEAHRPHDEDKQENLF